MKFISKPLYFAFVIRFRYETYFVFATVWAFGSAMFQDQVRFFFFYFKRLLYLLII